MAEETKQALAESLMLVLQKKPLDKVTISDVTSLCNVNRQTFYYHFHDLNDLINWIYITNGEQIIGAHLTNTTWQKGLLDIMRSMQKYEAFVLQTYHSRARDLLRTLLLKSCKSVILGVINDMKQYEIAKEDRDFISSLYSYSITGTVLDWIEHGMKENPSSLVGKMDKALHGSIIEAASRFAKEN